MSAPRTRGSSSLARALLLIAALSVCGDDEPSGPSANFDLVGQWDWRVTNATSQGASCSVTAVTLTFTRDNGVLSGRRASSGNNIQCSVNGTPSAPASLTGDMPIQSLALNGTTISFDFANLSAGAWEMDGTVTGDNTMSGTATIRPGPSGGSWELRPERCGSTAQMRSGSRRKTGWYTGPRLAHDSWIRAGL